MAPQPGEGAKRDASVTSPAVETPSSDAYDNPWRTSEIIVVIEDEANMARNITQEVTETLRYWESSSSQQLTAYTPNYRLTDTHPNPDIRVKLVRTVEGCGVHKNNVAVGCAPVLEADSTVENTTTIQVRAGHTQATTLAILKHEFGHTLGLRHGEGNGNVMSGNLSSQISSDITDAADRRYPWGSEKLKVAVTSSNELTPMQRERLRNTIKQYEHRVEGEMRNSPSFQIINNPREADVVVSLRKSAGTCPATGPPSSCATWSGPDVDGDKQPEYYTRAHIIIGTRSQTHAWSQIGYWLGKSLHTENDSMPHPS